MRIPPGIGPIHLLTIVLDLGPSATDNHRQSLLHIIRFNIYTFALLLELLRDELDRVKGEDVKSSGSKGGPKHALADRLSPLARRVLAPIRIYSFWFSKNGTILTQLPDPSLVAKSRELWEVYAASLTALAEQFPVPELPEAGYMLQEEADLVGFVPLADDERKMWEHNGVRKPRKSDSDKGIGPDGEVLARVRVILATGVQLVMDKVSPG